MRRVSDGGYTPGPVTVMYLPGPYPEPVYHPRAREWPAMPEPHAHEWVDIQRLGDPEPVYICSRCGAARGDR